MNKNTSQQIKRFLICGGAAAGTDFITYQIFLNFVTYSIAKAISFICGAGVAYFANKFYTFEKPDKCYKEAARFTALYITTFFVNVGSNKLALLFISESKLLGFIIATIITMICNFIGQKWFVFRAHNKLEKI